MRPAAAPGPAVGRICAEDDPAAIALALRETLELRSDDATAAACRERAQAFSTARCVQAYELLYEELLSR